MVSFNNLHAENFINTLPGLIWVKDINLRYVLCNENLKDFVGFPKKSNLIGHDDYNLPWAEYADAYRDGDKHILQGKTLKFLHPCRLYDGNYLIIITRKSPFYDDSQKIIGITGYISVVNASYAVDNLFKLDKFDNRFADATTQKTQYILTDNFDHFGLSKREVTCLFYLIRGKTAKEISEILSISKRTAEKHLESLRIKLDCKSKSEIISKAIDYGFVNVIPHEFFLNCLRNLF